MRDKKVELKEAIRQVIEDGKIIGQWGLVVLEKDRPD